MGAQLLWCNCSRACGQVDLSQQPGTHAATHSPQAGQRRKLEEQKWRNLKGRDKESLTGKGKGGRGDKQHKGTRSPPPTSRPVLSQSLSNSHLGSQPPLLPPSVFIGDMRLHCTEYPLLPTWVTSPGWSPPSLSPALTPLVGGAEWETGEAPMLRKHCSAIAKALGSYQHCFSHRSKTQHHTSCCAEN